MKIVTHIKANVAKLKKLIPGSLRRRFGHSRRHRR